MAKHPKLVAKNRLGCFVITLVVLAALLLAAAIGLGWFGNVDMGKITGLPIRDNHM